MLGGEKELLFGKEKITYKEGDFVISCADVPVMCRIKKASKESPFLIIEIELDKKLISDLIVESKCKGECFAFIQQVR